ncbi:hypothetical protein RhiirC2_710401 [Rhizophagus irregularis]|uniref:Uncharacterized protein n=1 Tax=Rhizophagus irregularis TaxID=588596 RepID=A0A2N1NEU1_9GLOM|nr:hypothetical protein RhiirC2_710401 [Rhizophagus irregularis]
MICFFNATKIIIHESVSKKKLDILRATGNVENLKKRVDDITYYNRNQRKALDLKCQLKKYGREINEEKENETVTPVKRKAIEKDKFSKKSKKDEKGKEQLKADEESFMVSTSISFNYSSISKIYLSEIVQNIIPNLVYLDSCDKSKSTIESIEQRFPDEITDWSRNITCEKDIWSATDANIFDTLTSLEQPIYFLDDMAFCQHMTRLGFLKEELWEKIMADLASKNRYAPFLEKPIMIADNVDEESDSSDKEQKDLGMGFRIKELLNKGRSLKVKKKGFYRVYNYEMSGIIFLEF